ncbi:hypothetical protein [Pectobacterium carotovorum]|uniref:hypothetical protein n=1 Tax=Pectobacterium carotovorum TaxID=554 RepID=UPI00137394D0|nr:hypothetical protein [Pectobacterium carotovorum]QHP58532.1 hypothetical protein EH204_11400 [Pectobacterium carotovorum subsp. carotovorum]
MSVQGRDFILAARQCFDLKNEIGYRNSISRSYYALYHETCNMLSHCPPTTHEGVVSYLLEDARRKKESYELTSLIQLGAVLRQQKIKRKKADYNLNDSIIESEAIGTIELVCKMINKIDEMKSKAA